MTSTIRDVTKAGVQAEKTYVDLLGNAINENGQTAALTLDKLFDLLSNIAETNTELGRNTADRVFNAVEDGGWKRGWQQNDKRGWGDESTDDGDATTTEVDLGSTDLGTTDTVATAGTLGVTDSRSATLETAADAPVAAAAPAPAAAAAAGSGFPDASTTGVPAGTALKTYSGPMTITKAGTVIENMVINGTLRVTAPDVVIKNCVINYSGTWGIDAEGAKNITVQNCDITGPGYNGIANAAILGSGNFIGNDISKSENGIVLQNGASTVKGNFIHDLQAAGSDPHYDGISVQGGQNGVLIEGNTVISRDTSNIFIKNDFGPISNVTVNNNLLLGTAGYNVYVDGRANGGAITGVKITNNHVEKGYYGYYSVDKSSPVISGNFEYPRGEAPQPGDGSVSPTPPTTPTEPEVPTTPTEPETPTTPTEPETPTTPTEPETPTTPTNPTTKVYTGTSGNDIMPAAGQSNSGNETFKGLGGNDLLKGGAGADVLDGGSGRDTATYAGSGAVNVNLATGAASGGHAAGDKLVSIENLTGSSYNDVLTGNSGRNVLDGGAGADKLDGGAGRDVIIGGAGKDIMTGGADADTFAFHAPTETGSGWNRDVITDFQKGVDKIDLSAIDANGSARGDGSFHFIAQDNGKFDKVAGALAWRTEDNAGTANDITVIQGDLNGDGVHDFEIQLQGLVKLSASDFIL